MQTIVDMLKSMKDEFDRKIDNLIADVQSGNVSVELPSTVAALNAVGGVRTKSVVPYSVKMPDGTIIAEITGQRTFELALQAFFKNPENKKMIPGNSACNYDISMLYQGENPIISLKVPMHPAKYNKRGNRWYRRGLKIADQITILEYLGMNVEHQ